MSPYDELPESEKLKDHLFTALVATFTPFVEIEEPDEHNEPSDDEPSDDEPKKNIDGVPETETAAEAPAEAGQVEGRPQPSNEPHARGNAY